MANKTLKNKKILILALILVCVGALSAGVLVYKKTNQPTKTAAQQTEQDQLQQQEARANPDPKQNEASFRQQQSQADTGSKSSAINPIITTLEQGSDGILILDATVGSATSGTCTATLTKTNAPAVTKSLPVVRVTSYYACQELQLAKGTLSPGEWSVQVGLSSTQGSGISAIAKITIK